MSKIDWRTEEVKSLADYFYKILTTAPIGLCMHIVEIYCEELAKVSSELNKKHTRNYRL